MDSEFTRELVDQMLNRARYVATFSLTHLRSETSLLFVCELYNKSGGSALSETQLYRLVETIMFRCGSYRANKNFSRRIISELRTLLDLVERVFVECAGNAQLIGRLVEMPALRKFISESGVFMRFEEIYIMLHFSYAARRIEVAMNKAALKHGLEGKLAKSHGFNFEEQVFFDNVLDSPTTLTHFTSKTATHKLTDEFLNRVKRIHLKAGQQLRIQAETVDSEGSFNVLSLQSSQKEHHFVLPVMADTDFKMTFDKDLTLDILLVHNGEWSPHEWFCEFNKANPLASKCSWKALTNTRGYSQSPNGVRAFLNGDSLHLLFSDKHVVRTVSGVRSAQLKLYEEASDGRLVFYSKDYKQVYLLD